MLRLVRNRLTAPLNLLDQTFLNSYCAAYRRDWASKLSDDAVTSTSKNLSPVVFNFSIYHRPMLLQGR